MNKNRLAVAMTMATLIACSPAQAKGAFWLTGHFDVPPSWGSGITSSISAMSDDGGTVVGSSNNVPFIWTESAGLKTFSGAPPVPSQSTRVPGGPLAVSGDGSVVVFAIRGGSMSMPMDAVGLWFRDTPGQVVGIAISRSNLLRLSYATGISSNGKVVVGGAYFDGLGVAGYRWTMTGRLANGTVEGVTEVLPRPSPTTLFGPVDVSADGRVLAGNGSLSSGAFRWSSEGGFQNLGVLPGYLGSTANAISNDGEIIVGSAFEAIPETVFSNRRTQAFLWSQQQGLKGLGVLPGTAYSDAVDVSANGRVVIGNSWTGDGGITQAFRWTQETGLLSVEQWLLGNGIALPEGTKLSFVVAVNADGSILAGNLKDGSNAWIARVEPHRGGILLDVDDYQRSLVDANQRLTLGLGDLANATLSGAHHRSLLDNGLASESDGSCAWANAETADYDATKSRTEQLEVGVCTDLGPARLGLGLGKAKARQEWNLGSQSKSEGEYLLGEAAFKLGEQWQGSLLGYSGRFDVDSQRRYYNGTAVHTSSARPDAKVAALRARLDWKDAARVGGVGISPYAAYTWTRTKLDGYTESGGGFPSRFDRTDWSTRDLRVGAAFERSFGERNDLSVSLEAVRRMDKISSGTRGEIIDLFSFDLPGGELDRNWGQMLVDFDHRFANGSVLGVGARAASSGGDADWGVSASYRLAF